MTDNEIIKALECCSKNEPCNICSYYKKEEDEFVCCSKLMLDALDLINRQKAEIERLINAYKQCAWERDAYIEIENTSITEAKAEAIREFAERLKFIMYPNVKLEYGDIDNLVKETVGDVR